MRKVLRMLRRHYFTILGEPFGLGECDSHRELLRRTKAQLRWELRHVYDRTGRRNPDALALLVGYALGADREG